MHDLWQLNRELIVRQISLHALFESHVNVLFFFDRDHFPLLIRNIIIYQYV